MNNSDVDLKGGGLKRSPDFSFILSLKTYSLSAMKYFIAILSCLFAAGGVSAQSVSKTVKTVTITETTSVERTAESKRVALFVRNDSGNPKLADCGKNLEFALSARLNNLGFAVVNHDLALRNLNDYLGNPNAKYRSEASNFKRMFAGDSPDAKLFENASGLRIAEFVGADYILSVSIGGLTAERKVFDGYDIKTLNTTYRLRASYNIYGGDGAGTAGGAVKTQKTLRQTGNLIEISDDVLDSLLDDTAAQMAAKLGVQNEEGGIVSKGVSFGEVGIVCELADLSFPEIVLKNGRYELSNAVVPVKIPHITADIDGMAHTLGGKIKLSKGVHILKIHQRDIVPVEKTFNITGSPDQTLAFTLNLTDEARNRWKADMAFVEEMKNRAKLSDDRRILTEAEAERIRGIARMFEQSGFKVDAKALPEIRRTQSIFGQ